MIPWRARPSHTSVRSHHGHSHAPTHGRTPWNDPSPPPIVAGQKDGGRNTYVTRQNDGTRREGRGETWIKRVTGYLILSSSLATPANHFSSSFLLRVFAPRLFRLLRPATIEIVVVVLISMFKIQIVSPLLPPPFFFFLSRRIIQNQYRCIVDAAILVVSEF